MTPQASDAAGRFADVTAALLLGGASRRMGRDKAALSMAPDAPPAAVALSRGLAGLFGEVLLVGGDPPAGTEGRPVADSAGPACALRGVVTALEVARGDRVLVVATDLPGLSADLVLALLAWPEAEAVVPQTEDGLQPLCALYRRSAAPKLRARLDRGALSVRGVLDDLEVARIAGPDLEAVDPDGLALRNVNTPDELAAFREQIGSTSGPRF